jgi:hypothetical protein
LRSGELAKAHVVAAEASVKIFEVTGD